MQQNGNGRGRGHHLDARSPFESLDVAREGALRRGVYETEVYSQEVGRKYSPENICSRRARGGGFLRKLRAQPIDPTLLPAAL